MIRSLQDIGEVTLHKKTVSQKPFLALLGVLASCQIEQGLDQVSPEPLDEIIEQSIECADDAEIPDIPVRWLGLKEGLLKTTKSQIKAAVDNPSTQTRTFHITAEVLVRGRVEPLVDTVVVLKGGDSWNFDVALPDLPVDDLQRAPALLVVGARSEGPDQWSGTTFPLHVHFDIQAGFYVFYDEVARRNLFENGDLLGIADKSEGEPHAEFVDGGPGTPGA